MKVWWPLPIVDSIHSIIHRHQGGEVLQTTRKKILWIWFIYALEGIVLALQFFLWQSVTFETPYWTALVYLVQSVGRLALVTFSFSEYFPPFPSPLLFLSAKKYIFLLQIFSTFSFIFPPSSMQSYWKLHTRRDLEPVFRWGVGGWIHAGDLLGECWKYTCVL